MSAMLAQFYEEENKNKYFIYYYYKLYNTLTVINMNVIMNLYYFKLNI